MALGTNPNYPCAITDLSAQAVTNFAIIEELRKLSAQVTMCMRIMVEEREKMNHVISDWLDELENYKDLLSQNYQDIYVRKKIFPGTKRVAALDQLQSKVARKRSAKANRNAAKNRTKSKSRPKRSKFR